MITINPRPTEEESAAALAAVSAYLMDEQEEAVNEEEFSRWEASAFLAKQGLGFTRTAFKPEWGIIERIKRAGRGNSGITGL